MASDQAILYTKAIIGIMLITFAIVIGIVAGLVMKDNLTMHNSLKTLGKDGLKSGFVNGFKVSNDYNKAERKILGTFSTAVISIVFAVAQIGFALWIWVKGLQICCTKVFTIIFMAMWVIVFILLFAFSQHNWKAGGGEGDGKKNPEFVSSYIAKYYAFLVLILVNGLCNFLAFICGCCVK